MDARSAAPCHRLWTAVAAVVVVATIASAEEAPPSPPTFQPGELSIGEPIALPFGSGSAGAATPPVGPPPGDDPRSTQPPAAAGSTVPGSGWLGLAVAESPVPGRWRVEEVAADGPAARAGITVGDELRAVNGVPLAGTDDVAQTLTTIAAGQDVRVAVARNDRVTDLVLRAEQRPAPRGSESQRFPQQPAADVTDSAAVPPGPAAAPAAAPVPAVQAPAAAASADADVTRSQWQEAPGRVSEPATGSRFAPRPAFDAPAHSVATPAPAAVTRSSAATAVAAPAVATGSGRTALGVRTVPIDPVTQARFHLPEPSGAYVIGVVHDLPAARAGVPPGSVIVAIGGQPVRSPVELTRMVTSGPVDKPVTVQFVLPGGESKRADVVLQALDAPLERALAGDGLSATSAPAFEPAPRRAERPILDGGAIRSEIRFLRGRLERLEKLLDAAPGP